MYLFDTVALSESAKHRVNAGFLHWRAGVRGWEVHTSILCLGELERGIVMAVASDERAKLVTWLSELTLRLGARVLDVDMRVARAWGQFGRRGKVEPVDALIGATAAVHGLTVVTRNTRHFDGLGVAVLNPWS